MVKLRLKFESVDELIDAMGGTCEVARLVSEATLGAPIGPSCISNWRDLGIPADWFPVFRKILGFEPPERLFKFRPVKQ